MFSTFSWYFLSLRGRISRREFRLGYFGIVILNALLVRIMLNITVPAVRYYSDRRELDYADHWPVVFMILVTLWPTTAVCVKRLHDMNVSGWWMLSVFAISFVSSAIHVSVLIIVLLLVAVFSLIPGSRGANRFGPDPLAQAGPNIRNLA
jgi:uncharacterized membrane protein YhaH (DUF805 family)